MELELKRTDLGYTTTTEPGTLKVMPISKDAPTGQRVVVGDTQGIVQSFCFKKGELVLLFKTVPGARKINTLVTGLSPAQRDKVYTAEGSVVKGYDKKGATFFKFTTPLTEDIRGLAIAGLNLFAFCEYSLTQFLETTESSFYLAPERINCSCIVPLTTPTDYNAVLACADRVIRIMDGKTVIQEIEIENAPTAIAHFALAHDVLNQHATRKELFYGTNGGDVAQLFVDATTSKPGTVLRNSRNRGSVTRVFSGFDLTKDGVDDIVVGRDDGSIEIYDMNDQGNLQQCWEANVRESIHTIDAGCVTSTTDEEYIFQLYSGGIVSYSTGQGLILPAAISPSAGTLQGSPAQLRKDADQRAVTKLQQEIQQLQASLKEARATYASKSEGMVATQQMLAMKHSLQLNMREAVYELKIEAGVPIHCVCVQSTVDVQLLDSQSAISILTVSQANAASGAAKLATYRCQDSTMRLVILMRIREGHRGTVSAYVVPKSAPKTCEMIQHQIKSLCLHRRITMPEVNRPYSHLEISGDFVVAEMHRWVSSCLPEMPKYVPGEQVKLAFEGTLLGTQLIVTYGNGSAKLSSDNPCTLAVLRDDITREATQSSIRVTVINLLEKATIAHFLRLLWPLLQQERSRNMQLKLIEALEEIKVQEPDLSFLTADMKSLLDNAATLRGDAKASVNQMQPLDALIEQVGIAFREWSRNQGNFQAQQQLPRLEAMLRDTHSTLDTVTAFVLGDA